MQDDPRRTDAPDNAWELERRVEQLQTQVFLLGSVAGIMLSLLGQLGWEHVTGAIYQGLADAGASIPPHSEADWDNFMALIRTQGEAVKVERVDRPQGT